MAGPHAQGLLTPAEAERQVLAAMPSLGDETVPLAQARGRILREDVAADRPLPPYDRVTLDGYALRSGDVAAGVARFRIAGFQPAGSAPLELPKGAGVCVEVGTGAVLPGGADCVVPYEETARDGADVILRGARPAQGSAVHARGSDRPAGDVLLRCGTVLQGRELAVAAACGRARLKVSAPIRIGILVTGDELADPGSTVEPWQQRRSNDLALAAALESVGAVATVRLARDDEVEMAARLAELLDTSDVVVTSGGISRGRMDLLPALFEKAGVRKIFQGVAQRPGKPLWFGTRGAQPVFGLPGNPVSSYTCLHRYVLPALARASGATAEHGDVVALAGSAAADAKLTLYVPARVSVDGLGRRTAVLAPFNTSGDLAALLGTDGFVELPQGAGDISPGFLARFRRWV